MIMIFMFSMLCPLHPLTTVDSLLAPFLCQALFLVQFLKFLMSTCAYCVSDLAELWKTLVFLLCCKNQIHSSCFLYLPLLHFKVPLSTPAGRFLKTNQTLTFSA